MGHLLTLPGRALFDHLVETYQIDKAIRIFATKSTVGHLLKLPGRELFDYLVATYQIDIAIQIFSTSGIVGQLLKFKGAGSSCSFEYLKSKLGSKDAITMCTSSAEILREFLLSSHCAAVPAQMILPGTPAINPVQQQLAVTEFTQIKKKFLQKDAARKKIAYDEKQKKLQALLTLTIPALIPKKTELCGFALQSKKRGATTCSLTAAYCDISNHKRWREETDLMFQQSLTAVAGGAIGAQEQQTSLLQH